MATANLTMQIEDFKIMQAAKEMFPDQALEDTNTALSLIISNARQWHYAQKEKPAPCPTCKRDTTYRDSIEHEIGCNNCGYTLRITHEWSKPEALKLWERIQGRHLKNADWLLTGKHHDDKKIIIELLGECLPAIYGDDLSENQIDHIAEYMVTNLTNS